MSAVPSTGAADQRRSSAEQPKFNMALGHVLGGGSSINAMVWTRGVERDYDAWERERRQRLGLEGRAADLQSPGGLGGRRQRWRGVGGPVHIRTPAIPSDGPAFIEAARQMGFPVIDDMNGPMRAGAGYINMNIAADGSRVSSARAFLRRTWCRT